jgi:hypothetical protein
MQLGISLGWSPGTLVVLIGATAVLVATGSRLLRGKIEALAVLAGLPPMFALGFAGPFLDRNWHLAFIATGIGIGLAVAVTAGRTAETRWGAAVAAAAFVPLAVIAVGYGIYLARETGWHGLTPLGSRDHWGRIGSFWAFFILGFPLWAIPAVLTGVLGYIVNSKSSVQSTSPP